VTKRTKAAREPVSPAESDNDSPNELVVEDSHRDERPAAKKRFMRMHADEMQNRSINDRLGACNRSRFSSDVRSDVRDRLGLTSKSSSDTDSDSHRSGRREVTDLRNRLSRR